MDMKECTKPIALGGDKFRDKWETPEVIGRRAPKRSDRSSPVRANIETQATYSESCSLLHLVTVVVAFAGIEARFPSFACAERTP